MTMQDLLERHTVIEENGEGVVLFCDDRPSRSKEVVSIDL